jgi:polyadenylate-binding protein 2
MVQVDKQLAMPTSPTGNLNLSFEEKMEVDARSVYIGNVDYAATAEELEQHFHGCGSINRSAACS